MWHPLLCLVMTCQYTLDTPNLLKGDTIEVTSQISHPFLMAGNSIQDTDGVGNERYEGYLVDLLKLLEKKLGATININLVKDGRYGYSDLKAGSQWNGMIGEVLRGDVEMAVADLTVTQNRVRYVDFTQPFMSGGLVVLAPASAPDTIQEMVDQGYKIKGVQGGSTQNLFQSSKAEIHTRMKKNLDFSCDSLITCFNEMLANEAEKEALVVESNTARFLASQDCSVKILSERLNDISYSMAIAKGSAKRNKNGLVYDIRNVLDEAITGLKYDGSLISLEQKWWPEPNC